MINPAEDCALKLLTQREHSGLELRRKLARRGYTDSEIKPLLEKLSQQGWQDDLRFAIAYTHSRQQRGYGPLRIAQELSLRGITDEQIKDVLDTQAEEWPAVLNKLIHKKYKGSLAKDFSERAKQHRFLQYRGFSPGQIQPFLG